MAESFAGITVPEGEPDTIRDAAQTFHGVAGGLHGASSDLRSVPGLVSDWKGPASAAFGGTVVTNGSCVDEAAAAMSTCAQAARTYADDLEQAQKDARQAIADARDAQKRIDDAQGDLEAALGAETSASDAMSSAGARLSSGVPDPSASADYDAASSDLQAAQAAAGDARRRLEQAQADLEAAQRRGHQAEKDATDAARAAASAFDGVAGHSPAAAMFGGSPTAIESEVLARVRAGDYSVLDTVPFNYLPKDTQRAIAAEIAQESYKVSYGEGSHTMEQMAGVVRHFEHDDEFATGFYNQLGGGGARNLADDIILFYGNGKGLKDPSLVALMAPFATLLGTATRSRDLRSDFTDEFIGDAPMRDRIPGHLHLATFIMAGAASNYSAPFLSRVGKEILVDSQNTEEGAPPWVELSEYQDFMKFMAGNHEASGMLLAGHYGEAGLSNVLPLLEYGPRWTDNGDALGALIQAGTHDLRLDGNYTVSNDAAHALIQGVPEWHDSFPDGAKPALVQIVGDHIEDIDFLATERAQPGMLTEHPHGFMNGLTYDESTKYLTTLIGDDHMRDDTSQILGDRVGYDISQAASTGDSRWASRAGALSETSVISTAEAHLDHARAEAAMNNIAKSATNKIIFLTPVKKIPLVNVPIGKGLDALFNTDQVEQVLQADAGADLDAYKRIKQISIQAQVQYGQLPPEALDMLRSDGTIDASFVDGPNGTQDLVRVDADLDGKPDGGNISFDLNHNGHIDRSEETITEQELYDATRGNSETAADSMAVIRTTSYDAAHPPSIDDLPVPDGYSNDNPNFVEKIWPFGDDGGGTIEQGGHIVAHQDDLRYDPAEHQYVLSVDDGHGGTTELRYERGADKKWHLVD
jgi:uncharacterized protein YukE